MKIRVEWTTPEDSFEKTFTTYQRALDYYTSIRDGDTFWSTIEMWRIDKDKPELLAVEEKSNYEIDKKMHEEEDLSLREEFSDDIEKFINDIYELRKDSIANDGEYGLGNLVFKEFRNLGYLDNLKELRKQEKGKELSLENLDNITNNDYNDEEVIDLKKSKNELIQEAVANHPEYIDERGEFDLFSYGLDHLDEFPELKSFGE